MARRIQQVDDVLGIGELHHRGRDRNTPLLLQRHPVRGRVPAGLAALHGTGELDRAAVQQQFFGQRRFAGIRMRDDRKGAAFTNLVFEALHWYDEDLELPKSRISRISVSHGGRAV